MSQWYILYYIIRTLVGITLVEHRINCDTRTSTKLRHQTSTKLRYLGRRSLVETSTELRHPHRSTYTILYTRIHYIIQNIDYSFNNP